MDPERRKQLPHRRRWAFASTTAPHRRDLRRVRGLRAAGHGPTEGAGRTVPVPRNRQPRPVRLAGPHLVLRLLRSLDRRDVLHHRRLGARKRRPICPQVLPLHLSGLARPASRLHRLVPRFRTEDVRHGRARRRSAVRRQPGDRELRARRDLPRPRHQDTHLPVPHLAATGTHGCSRDRFGRARRNPAQDGHLRLHPHRHADAARRVAVVGVVHRGPRHRLGAVRRSRRPRSDRCQTDDRLHLGESHGVRRACRRRRGSGE